MGVGLGIFLLVLGAVITFTNLDSQLLNMNLDIVGWILMAGGLLSLIMALTMNKQRANTSHTSVVESRNLDEQHVVEHPRERVVEREDPRP